MGFTIVLFKSFGQDDEKTCEMSHYTDILSTSTVSRLQTFSTERVLLFVFCKLTIGCFSAIGHVFDNGRTKYLHSVTLLSGYTCISITKAIASHIGLAAICKADIFTTSIPPIDIPPHHGRGQKQNQCGRWHLICGKFSYSHHSDFRPTRTDSKRHLYVSLHGLRPRLHL